MGEVPGMIDNELYEMYHNAVDFTQGKFSYINNVHITFSKNEIVMDMYFLAPDSRSVEPITHAQLLQRIVIPPHVARNVAELLLDVANKWEITFDANPLKGDEGSYTNE